MMLKIWIEPNKIENSKKIYFFPGLFKDYPLENEEHLPNRKCQNIREDM